MKNLLKSLLITLLVVGCSKEDTMGPIMVTKSKTITKNKLASVGFNGGKTEVGSSSSGKSNSEMFISQFPLVEYRHIQEIKYDSIITVVVDSISNDTISSNYELVEISRDTVEVKTGPIYWPFRANDNALFMQIYVGVNMETVNKDEVSIKIENILGNPNETQTSLSLRDPSDPFGKNGAHVVTLAMTQENHLPENYYEEVDDVPLYNEEGKIIGYQPGIKLFLFDLFKEYEGLNEQHFKYRFTIRTSSTSSVSIEFPVIFVPRNIYDDRQCWLANESGCEDLFEE